MCAEMGLISVDKDSKTVRLTDRGWTRQTLNPQLDEGGDNYSSISRRSSMLIKHANKLPKDWEFCRRS